MNQNTVNSGMAAGRIKKIISIVILSLILSSCSILEELISIAALTKCEYSFHSAQDPVLSDIDVMRVQSFTDLTLMDGLMVVKNIKDKRLPFGITANVEVKNPGTTMAAVNFIDWIAFIDDVQITTGRVNNRIEIAANGGTAVVPIRIETDLFEYLEGDNPRTMLNFGLNLMDVGGQPTRLSLKIKPSIKVGTTTIASPEYFTIEKVFSSGD